MKSKSQLTKENFGKLLVWLSPDKELAGEKYEEIRQGLIRFFRFRGCSEPELLTDETISRVAQKFSTLDFSKKVKKITIFYGFALNIYREYLREFKNKEIEFDPDLSIQQELDNSAPEEREKKLFILLDKCLDKLNSSQKKLLLRYYSKEKKEKIKMRQVLAKENNISLKTLHVKIYRIKTRVKKCIESQIKKKM